ncbi:MAG TPA: cofactor-independent phosphoglycerate mutase [Clostridiales bacterium]|nr:cofactor-independent phosphoglycerate mutase [Clostridiales bacterium]
MKYIVILGDGMADYPVPQLGGKTPLQCAVKPNMDYIASKGISGMVKTIPDGMAPGSDVANLSVMGYDPEKYYTGRSPLEAVSMGIKLGDNDKAFRCNLVTLSDGDNYMDKTMVDYSSDEISSKEGAELIKEINNYFQSSEISFYPGVSYRHCMVWENAPDGFKLTPPHDISGKNIASFIPEGKNSSILFKMMEDSYNILKGHKINIERLKRGLNPANSIWLWGEGKKPSVPGFYEKYGIKGSVISAVDLVKGLGICMGLSSINVQGATGNLNTNFAGKADAALNELEAGQDFVYIHIEAPDECGHRYEIDNKVKSIELIDEQVIGRLLAGLKNIGDYRMLLLPDHPTPLAIRTHASDPVPFVMYGEGINNESCEPSYSAVSCYDEFEAKKSGLFVGTGCKLMDYFISGKFE